MYGAAGRYHLDLAGIETKNLVQKMALLGLDT